MSIKPIKTPRLAENEDHFPANSSLFLFLSAFAFPRSSSNTIKHCRDQTKADVHGEAKTWNALTESKRLFVFLRHFSCYSFFFFRFSDPRAFLLPSVIRHLIYHLFPFLTANRFLPFHWFNLLVIRSIKSQTRLAKMHRRRKLNYILAALPLSIVFLSALCFNVSSTFFNFSSILFKFARASTMSGSDKNRSGALLALEISAATSAYP